MAEDLVKCEVMLPRWAVEAAPIYVDPRPAKPTPPPIAAVIGDWLKSNVPDSVIRAAGYWDEAHAYIAEIAMETETKLADTEAALKSERDNHVIYHQQFGRFVRPQYPFLMPVFLEAMNDIGRYGFDKYGDQAFQARAERGEMKRWMTRVETAEIANYAADHFRWAAFDKKPHDHFHTITHQFAASAFNVMMEAYLSGALRPAAEQQPEHVATVRYLSEMDGPELYSAHERVCRKKNCPWIMTPHVHRTEEIVL